jgi:hypothetical protein
VGENTPTPLGPPSIDGVLGELVTAVDGAAVPSAKTVVLVVELVLVWDEGALLDEVLLPEVPLVDTASCPREVCDESVTKMSVNTITDNRLNLTGTRFEPRLEQETRNRFVARMESLRLIDFELMFSRFLLVVQVFANG